MMAEPEDALLEIEIEMAVNSVESEEEDSNWFEFVPLGFCIAIFLGIILYICIDFRGAIKLFTDMVDYTREHPYEAIAILVVVYILLIIFCMPIT